MTPEQRAILGDMREAHHQRWLAREFLLAVPPEVRAGLSKSRVVVRPESDPIAGYHRFAAEGVGHETAVRPVGYTFGAYPRPDDVRTAMGAFGPRTGGEVAYLRPHGFWARADGGQPSFGEPPLFEVGFGWACRHFAELYAAANRACGLTTRGGEVGFLTRVVCGYLDRPADDPVYEVACWGGRPA